MTSAAEALDLCTEMLHAAQAWAKADREADDRSADLMRAEAELAAYLTPTPASIPAVAKRDAAAAAFKEACSRETKAGEAMMDAARALLVLDEDDL